MQVPETFVYNKYSKKKSLPLTNPILTRNNDMIITIREDSYVRFPSIANVSEKTVFYPDILGEDIVQALNDNNLEVATNNIIKGLAILTGKLFSTEQAIGMTAYIPLEKTGSFTVSDDGKPIECRRGSILLAGYDYLQKHNLRYPKSLLLYEKDYLPAVSCRLHTRLSYNRHIAKSLQKTLGQLPPYKQCIRARVQDMSMLGGGDYGHVSGARVGHRVFAVKFAAIVEEEDEGDTDTHSWHESLLLRDIIQPILAKKMCPNLPYLLGRFTCDDCMVRDEEGENKDKSDIKSKSKSDIKSKNNSTDITRCIIMPMELASRNLQAYLTTKPTTASGKFRVNEIYSALFQIMAALHAIQLYGQIMHFDVKKENILVYDVVPGGYWHYVIHGKHYYVPNMGQLFVLGDFGLSRSMSPDFELYRSKTVTRYRFGTRLALVRDGKFDPFEAVNQKSNSTELKIQVAWKATGEAKNETATTTTTGSRFVLDRKSKVIKPSEILWSPEQKQFLKKMGIPSDCTRKAFYRFPEIIPPFEFYNDTQDAIRMFTGGKRSTQKGFHRRTSAIPNVCITQLQKYIGPSESLVAKTTSVVFTDDPAQVLASAFIESFFPAYTKFSIKPLVEKGADILETYRLS